MTRDAESEDRYERLRRDLSRAVARVCPGWLADRRDDLVQVAVMRVMEIERKSEGDRELKTSYLYRVAYTTLVDEIRRHRRRSEVALEEETGAPVDGMTATNDPERTAAASEIGRGIRDCLKGLLAERRMAVALRLSGHSVPEAARLLGWTAKRTENLVYRGLADLRDCLEARGLSP